MEVIYEGIRLTPAQIVERRKSQGPRGRAFDPLRHPRAARPRRGAELREAGLGDVPVVVGGIIPAEDVNILKQCGVAAVYTPKDFQLNEIMTGIVNLVDQKVEVLAEADVPVPPLRAKEKVRL